MRSSEIQDLINIHQQELKRLRSDLKSILSRERNERALLHINKFAGGLDYPWGNYGAARKSTNRQDYVFQDTWEIELRSEIKDPYQSFCSYEAKLEICLGQVGEKYVYLLKLDLEGQYFTADIDSTLGLDLSEVQAWAIEQTEKKLLDARKKVMKKLA